MLRPNLFRFVTALVLFAACSRPASAQHGPHGGMFGPHQPLIQMPRSTYQAPIVDHYVQAAPSLWDDEQPIEKFLTEVSRRSWVRVEYLHWDIEGPGEGPVGAPITGLRSIDQQFLVTDNFRSTPTPVGVGELISNGGIDLSQTSGVRGTWGLSLNGGTLETSFFGTEEKSDTWTSGNIRNFRNPAAPGFGLGISPNLVLPLLRNGNVDAFGNMNSIIFDDRVDLAMSSQMWGAGAAFLTDPYVPGEGFKWQWLGGFRYLNLDESYRFRGAFDNGGANADLLTQFTSATSNNVYGPEFGGRAALVHRWFSLSVTPRVTFGINDNSAQVVSQVDARGTLVNPVILDQTQEEIDFCTITQLSFTGEVNVSQNFSLFAGYDFLWLPRVTRPHENVRFNSTPNVAGGGFIPDIGVNRDLAYFLVEGFSVGAVFRY